MAGTTRRSVNEKARELIDPKQEMPSLMMLLGIAAQQGYGQVTPGQNPNQSKPANNKSITPLTGPSISNNTNQTNTMLFNPTQQFNPFTLE